MAKPTVDQMSSDVDSALDYLEKTGGLPKEKESGGFLSGLPSMASGMPAYKPAPAVELEKKPKAKEPQKEAATLTEEQKKQMSDVDEALNYVASTSPDLSKKTEPAKPGEFPRIEAGKQAGIQAIESAAKAISAERPEPTQFDSAKHLQSLTPDQITQEIKETYKGVMDPEELKQWPEWFPKTNEQHRAVFDQKHADTTAGDIWNLGVKTGQAFLETVPRVAAGVAKAGATVLEAPGTYGPVFSPEEWKRYATSLGKLAVTPASTVAESVESVAQTAENAAKNGLRAIDWVEEKSDLITRDEAFDRYLRRARANEYWAHSKATDPNPITRLVFDSPFSKDLAEQFVYSINSVLSPSVEDRLARFKGDRAAALREKQLDDLQSTQEVIANFRRDASKMAPDPDFAEALSFTPAGMMSFDIYGRALGAGLSAASKAARSFKTAGKTGAEVAAMDAKAAEKAFASDVAKAKAAEAPTRLERAFGSIADAAESAGRKIEGALEAVPAPLKAGASSLAGGAVGALVDTEHPFEGFLLGAGTGVGGYLAKSGLAKGAKALAESPRVAQAALAGRRLAGGEGKTLAGTRAAIEKAEELGLDPWIAKQLADKGIPAAKAMDWVAKNVIDMARGSVHGATLAAAVGILENRDPEQIAEMMGQGVFWHMSGEVLKNLTGVSQSRLESNQKRQRAAAAKLYQSLDPESKSHLDSLTSWNTYIAQTRNLAEQAAESYANAKTELVNAVNAEKPPEQLQKIQEKVADAERIATIRRAQLKNAESAGPETARMFGDQVRVGLADMMNAINGSMTPGKNVELKFQTKDQLLEDVMHNNRDKMLDPLEQAELTYIVDGLAGQRAFHSQNGGEVQLSTGKTITLSNPNKTRITINMDRVLNRVLGGESVLTAAAHEIGHAFWDSKEFREQNAEVINKLFGTQKFDERGNLISGEPGLYSAEELVNRFKSDYASDATGGWEQTAKVLGLFDPATNDLRPAETAAYMRAEIMAELVQGGAQGGIKLGNNPKPWLAPLVDWATIKHKNSAAGKVIRESVGLTGEKPWASELLGLQFSGEMVEATKKALRATAELQGDISAAESIPHRKISETEIRANEAVAEQFKDGLFATEKVAMVVDAEGNPVIDPLTGKPTPSIPLSDQTIFEGSWESRESDTGDKTLVQTSGYGGLPSEVSQKFSNITVPDGGRIVIGTRVKRDSSGSLQMLTPDQIRELNRTRGALLRSAIESAPDTQYPGRLSPTSADRLSFGGVLSPGQVKALKELPETIVPYSLKRRILEFNELVVRDQGEGMIGLYAQAMDRNGKYRSFAPKIVDFIPLGLKVSKDGNFLFTLFSKSGMREKLRRWQKDSPELLQLWNGNEEAFMGDLKKVLENWKPTPESPTGRPGETGLDADLAMAVAKKNRINDFLNIFRKTEEASLLANPSRTTMRKPARRLTKEEKLDETSSDPNTLVRSYRVDRFHDLAKSSDEPLRVNYGKALYNLLPEGREAEETPRVFGPALSRGLRGVGFMPEAERDKTVVSPGFYSKMGRVLLEKMPNRASLDQIKGIIDPQKGSGVKPDEVKWSGILPYLEEIQAAKGHISKQDISDFLEDNYKAKFTTETLGESSKTWSVSDGGHTERYSTEEEAISARENWIENTYEGLRDNNNIYPKEVDGKWVTVDEFGNDVNSVRISESGKMYEFDSYYESEQEAEKDIDRALKRMAANSVSIEETGEDSTARFQDYAIPGGKNYKETILQFPDIGYTSRHFPDTPDYIGHIRTQEFGDMFLIEEVQSDLYQEGREKGYGKGPNKSDYSATQNPSMRDYWTVRNPDGNFSGHMASSAEDAIDQAFRRDLRFSPNIPDVPFKKDWPVQLFKRALKDAVESGKKEIAWVDGDVQAKRFDLSKTISSISHNVVGSKIGIYAFDKNGNSVISDVFSRSQLPDVVGKDLAQKILNGEGVETKTELSNGDVISMKRLSGVDLSVGGEGMRAFYDTILPNEIKKYVKQWGGKVKRSEMGDFGLWSIEITPEMQGIATRGQVQFMPEKPQVEEVQPREFEPAARRGIRGVSFMPQSRFFFTTSTERDQAIKELIQKGKSGEKEIEKLNKSSILHALTGIPGISVSIENARGVYKGDKEVSAITTIKAKEGADLEAARSRFMDLAKIFKQMEVLEEKVGAGREDMLGEVDEDGFSHIHSVIVSISKLDPSIVEEARKKAGIDGLTMADGRVELLNRGNDDEFEQRAAVFAQEIKNLGGNGVSSDVGVSAVRAYSESPQEYAGTVGYDDPSLHLQTTRGAGGADLGRLNAPLARKLVELGALPPPEEGKRSYFEAKDVTKQQAKFQNQIAKVWETLPDNDMSRSLVRRAYKSLAAEILNQWDLLTSGPDGMRFTSRAWSEGGEPYKSSEEAIRDIRENNRLTFLKTDPEAFGPPGADFSDHPLLEMSGRKDANGVPLSYNDLFRAVHDTIAHGMFGTSFGPVGEEGAYHTHARTIADPLARWAMATETRGQNSWVNYRDQMLNKKGMPIKKGEEGYIPLQDRGFATQKAALIPLEYVLTGDKEVDAPIIKLMSSLGPFARGSRPATKAESAAENRIVKGVKAEQKEAADIVKGTIRGSKASSLFVDSEDKIKSIVSSAEEVYIMPVRPLPNIVIDKFQGSVPKDLLKTKPEQYKRFIENLMSESAKVTEDPQRFTNPKGYSEFMRKSGISGDILMPPSMMSVLVDRPQEYLNLLQGGFHEEKTIEGTHAAAMSGLDGVMEMRQLIGSDGPPPFITALHHLWGTLSKQLPPLDQEALFLRLISNRNVLDAIEQSVNGTYSSNLDSWKEIVEKTMNETNTTEKLGNNAKSNANTYFLMLSRHNGKWGEVSDLYKNEDPALMRAGFWGLGHGPTGIKNKVQGFIGLTFGVKAAVLDRWRFVELNLPTAMQLAGKTSPKDYFEYTGKNNDTPEDPIGIYKLYGTVENKTPNFSMALYTGLEKATVSAINAHAPLKSYLGKHADAGGLHWVAWNAIKNEAVGHSSLDITKSYLQNFGRNVTAESFHNHVMNSTAYVEGENKGQIVRVIMKNGKLSVEIE